MSTADLTTDLRVAAPTLGVRPVELTLDAPPVVDMEATLAAAAKNTCNVCRGEITVMTYMGTGVCCGLHERVSKGQLTIEAVDAILAGRNHEDGIK